MDTKLGWVFNLMRYNFRARETNAFRNSKTFYENWDYIKD